MRKICGVADKAVGGVGLCGGRTNNDTVDAGEALNFWRVLIAGKKDKRLSPNAEMKLPHEPWLEFKMLKIKNQLYLRQTATFRPRDLWGRLYGYI